MRNIIEIGINLVNKNWINDRTSTVYSITSFFQLNVLYWAPASLSKRHIKAINLQTGSKRQILLSISMFVWKIEE